MGEFLSSCLDWAKRNAEVVWFGIWVFLFQVLIIVLYAVWATYPLDQDAVGEVAIYPYFRDVNIMIFFGFGFLMTFLRRYGYSAVSYSFLIAGSWELQYLFCFVYFIMLLYFLLRLFYSILIFKDYFTLLYFYV